MIPHRVLLLLIILAGGSSSALALGTRIVDQNPEATARGEAFAATADNPSAIYYNPAGITQLDGTRALLGDYGITLRARVRLDDPGHTSVTSSNPGWQFAPQSYLTYKPQGCPVAVGLGFYAPFGFSLSYPDDTPFRTLAHKGSIEYITCNPVIAWKINDQLSIGAGATINYGKAILEQGVFAKGDQYRLDADGFAYGFNAGILWTPHPMHSFGLNYRSATTLELNGHSNLNYAGFYTPTPFGPFYVPGVTLRQEAHANFNFPQTVVLGYSFRPAPDWNFEVNVDWTDWNSLNTVTVYQKSGNVALPFNWRSSFLYEFGLTKKFAGGWRVSGGYVYSENSVPNESFNPIVPDGNRHIYSIGVGRDMGRIGWDLAYQYTHGPSRDISNGTAADGTYRFDAHAVTLSLAYKF